MRRTYQPANVHSSRLSGTSRSQEHPGMLGYVTRVAVGMPCRETELTALHELQPSLSHASDATLDE